MHFPFTSCPHGQRLPSAYAHLFRRGIFLVWMYARPTVARFRHRARDCGESLREDPAHGSRWRYLPQALLP